MQNDDRISMLEKRITRIESLLEKVLETKLEPISSDNSGNVIASFDFSDAECLNNSGWKICNAEHIDSDDSLSFETIQIERTLGVFCDPMLINENLRMPIDDIKQVHVRLKSNVDASQKCMLRVYFTTEKSEEFSQSKSVQTYYPAGRMVDVYVDTKNRYWNGNLSKLRIDPVEGLRGSIEMELIELISSSGEVVYSVDFTKVADLQSTEWNLKNTSLVSCKGRLLFNVDMIEKKRIYTDPFIVTDKIDVEASSVKYIHIKLRTDIENPESDDVYMQVLFKTKSSNFWTQDKSMRFSYAHGKDIDAYIEVKQLFWKGRIIALRIDPFETYEGRTEIKLIELLSDIPTESNINLLEAKTRHLEDRFNKIYN
ncbi:MAG: hypothetical protein J6E38_09175 [Clostridia bacterium]|nr:hypothetical protein [Clostridia bacterium]